MAVRRVWIGLVLAGAAFAQDRGEEFLKQEQVAFALFEAQQWDAARAAFEKQIAIYAANPRPYYNIACSYALQGASERAATWLQLSIDHGWRNAEHLDRDTDWDGVRKSPPYKRVRARLDEVLQQDPPPLPQPRDPRTVPPSNSVARILATAFLEEQQLGIDPLLMEEHQVRARLFALYDRVMARLARYLEENGDAADADKAGRERVRIASMYGLRADPDSKSDARLREVSNAYVRLTAAEFVARWPGSRHLPDVLLWRAATQPPPKALQSFDRIQRDFPATDSAIRAGAEALVLRSKLDREDLRLSYLAFDAAYGRTELGRELLATRLWRVRLMARGIRDLPVNLFKPNLPAPDRGHLILVLLVAGDTESARAIAQARERSKELKDAPIGVIAFPERLSLEQERWLYITTKGLHVATEPNRLARYLQAPDVPLVLEFRNGELVR